MSDYTESNYTKTGKKLKSVNCDRIDLTYNEIYEVFLDNYGGEFIIDDVGDKRYVCIDDKCYYELVDDVAEATNTTDDIHDTNETKPKFKVGDKVKVISTDYICQYDKNIKVGDVGVIINITDSVPDPYRVKLNETDEKDCWWFTDKCIELVSDDVDNITENASIKSGCGQIVSDGGSSSYYKQKIPKGMLERFNTTGIIEAKDVIRLFLGNDFNMGNIFKAYCRVISLRNGKGKAGIDEQYDLTKVKYFTEDELNYYLENNVN